MAVQFTRVLGGGAFREVGTPAAAAWSPDGAVVVVGGDLGGMSRPGRDRSFRSRSIGWFPLAVYAGADLECLHLGTSRWPVNAIAVHPSSGFAVVGTGEYDGGYGFYGELLMLDLTTGERRGLLDSFRMVMDVAWRSDQQLDVTLAPATDEGLEGSEPVGATVSYHRDDWRLTPPSSLPTDQDAIAYSERAPKTPSPSRGNRDNVKSLLASTGRTLGQPWSLRRQVWDVEVGRHGDIYACLSGVLAERWSNGRLVWSRASGASGHQLVAAAPHQLVAHEHPGWLADRSLASSHSTIAWLDPESGSELHRLPLSGSVVVVSRSDGWLLLRASDRDAALDGRRASLVLRPDRSVAGEVDLGGYDLFNHDLEVRGAPDFLVLVGRSTVSWQDKWVAAVDEPREGQPAQVRRLFPLEWDPSRDGHLLGGPGAYLPDEASGPSLLLAGWVHDGRGLLPGNAFVVRRSYPTGELQWHYGLDSQVTDMDVNDDHVYVTLNDGTLVVLNVADGTLLHEVGTAVRGHRFVPTCVRVLGRNHIVLGSLDGRLIEATVDPGLQD